jgi:hypothetical protein
MQQALFVLRDQIDAARVRLARQGRDRDVAVATLNDRVEYGRLLARELASNRARADRASEQ